jgi:acetoin utilization protein AcuC
MSQWVSTGRRERPPEAGSSPLFRSIFVHSEEMGRFDFGLDHPFKPERVLKVLDLCNRYGLLNHPWMSMVPPSPIDPALLQRFHEPEYLRVLEQSSRGEITPEILQRGLGTEECPIVPGMYEWSLRVAGGTWQAMQILLSGEAEAAMNLHGGLHHGMPGHAEGFCYLNDIAVAILEAADRGNRIAYLDCDAHHGNGVQEAFYSDPRVLVISLHETGRTLYPWGGWETEIGEGDGRGFNVNVPLEPGTDDEVYGFAFQSVVLDLIRAFAPAVLVAQLGADTMISDPLTHLKLTNNGYQRAVREVAALCPRILALGGGGYDLFRTARCWTLAWAILNDLEPRDEFAGLVGGMMFGPEMEVGSLYDVSYRTEGAVKEKAMEEARRVVDFLRKTVFPVHGL